MIILMERGGKASIGQRAQGDVAVTNRAGRLELAYKLPSLLLASKAIEINQELNHTHPLVSCDTVYMTPQPRLGELIM